MRRLGPSSHRHRAARERLILHLMVGLVLLPGSASAQYMALTPPPKPEAPRIAAPDARKPAPAPAPATEHASSGPLPNQRTGPARQRTVRDICIGCDR